MQTFVEFGMFPWKKKTPVLYERFAGMGHSDLFKDPPPPQ